MATPLSRAAKLRAIRTVAPTVTDLRAEVIHLTTGASMWTPGANLHFYNPMEIANNFAVLRGVGSHVNLSFIPPAVGVCLVDFFVSVPPGVQLSEYVASVAGQTGQTGPTQTQSMTHEAQHVLVAVYAADTRWHIVSLSAKTYWQFQYGELSCAQ